MAESDAIAQISRARMALAQAKDLADIRAVRDMAEAVRLYARAAGLGQEAMNEAAEVKLRAERKAGEALAAMTKNPGGQPEQHRPTHAPSESVDRPTRLADLGITPKQSMYWQASALVPEPVFEEHIADAKADGRPLTTAGVVKLARATAAASEEQIVERIPDPGLAHRDAKIKQAYSKAVLQVMQGFMTIDPAITMQVLDHAARVDLQRFIHSLRGRLDTWESLIRPDVHVAGE